MEEKIEFTKVNIIGTKYIHIFEMEDGSFVKKETTKEDYEQLGKTNPTNPEIEKGRWYNSMACPRYDTKSGDLSPGEMAEDSDGRFIAKYGDYILFLKQEEIIENKIDKTVIDSAIAAANKQ